MDAAALGTLAVLEERPALFEAPLWDEGTGTLLYTDAAGGGVWRVDPSSHAVSCVVSHRKGIGGIAAHAFGGLIMGGRDVIWRRGEERVVLIANDPAWGLNRFNDIGTDPAGRLYAGALDYDPAEPDRPRNPGRLFVVDLDGSVRQVDDGLAVPNGIATSPDGGVLYLADTAARAVWAYDVDSHGDLHRRRTQIAFSEGEPDGIAMASDGALWVAVRDPGSISVFSDGALQLRFEAHTHPTSLCFGGADLHDLYLTTSGSTGPDGGLVGQVCKLRSPVAGQRRTPARIALAGITA